MGQLEGRIAIITGAGRGIGREHALLFAREGAKVVVNDLGGANDGGGADVGPAQQVADEIVAAGGQAVANTDNIATWAGARAVVEQAVETFGGLDSVVNNAGILRDGFIPTMEESQWDSVIAVHLKGHFSVLRHASAYWKAESKAGRTPNASVLNTSSGSGVTLPNAGPSNYGAAKDAIAALTLVAADELQRYGVRANAIAPVARTRLTEATPGFGDIMRSTIEEGVIDPFHPANISPLVAYLSTADCPITGQVYAVQGGSIQRLKGWHDVDLVETDDPWSIDAVRNGIEKWS